MPTVKRPMDVGGRMIRAEGGTPESQWLDSHLLQGAAACTAESLVPPDCRAVIVAPHPDDEVLACGGLIAELARLGRPMCVVAVTDGTASHPGSTLWPRTRLERERPLESAHALALLTDQAETDVPAQDPAARGTPLVSIVRLGEPDGALAHCHDRLAERLRELLDPQDVVFTTWRLDGHPDHEATGHACAWATARNGARLFETPVWGWHWAQPGDARIPWQRAHRLPLPVSTLSRKRAALRAFRSQLTPDPSTGRGPTLTHAALARVARPFEIFFG